jgi:hypothetical protein
VLDVDTIRDEVQTRLGIDTLQRLESKPVPWLMSEYCGGGGGVKWRTVLSESSICWRRYTINLALDCEGTQLTDEMLTTLDAFEDVIAACTRTIEFLMCEGELLFTDNRRAIHARTPIADGGASDRLMIRSWIRSC